MPSRKKSKPNLYKSMLTLTPSLAFTASHAASVWREWWMPSKTNTVSSSILLKPSSKLFQVSSPKLSKL